MIVGIDDEHCASGRMRGMTQVANAVVTVREVFLFIRLLIQFTMCLLNFSLLIVILIGHRGLRFVGSSDGFEFAMS